MCIKGFSYIDPAAAVADHGDQATLTATVTFHLTFGL